MPVLIFFKTCIIRWTSTSGEEWTRFQLKNPIVFLNFQMYVVSFFIIFAIFYVKICICTRAVSGPGFNIRRLEEFSK